MGAVWANRRRILHDLDGPLGGARGAMVGGARPLAPAVGVRRIIRRTAAAIEGEIGGYEHRDHRDADNPVDQLVPLHEEAPDAFDKGLVADEDGPFNPGAAGLSGNAPI